MFERTYTKLGISNYLKGIKSMISTEKTRKESLTRQSLHTKRVCSNHIRNMISLSDTSKDVPQAIHLKMYHKGQVKKSIRRMPWHWEPTKDVTSCEKLRGGANIR